MRPCDRVIAAQAEARVKVRVKVRVRVRVRLRLRVRVRVRVRVRARRLQAGSTYDLDRGIREGGYGYGPGGFRRDLTITWTVAYGRGGCGYGPGGFRRDLGDCAEA